MKKKIVPPGKTRKQLDRDIEHLRKQVEQDLKILCRPPHSRNAFCLDRVECLFIGFGIGAAVTLLFLGGCAH